MEPISITIDSTSGCCFGVVNAIEKAEKVLKDDGKLLSLGDIVHNSEEVSRLSKAGLTAIDKEAFNKLQNAKVLIRAHGEPPEVYNLAKKQGIEIIDATCPVVLKLQKRISEAYQQYGDTIQLVIYGKKGHAEVVGLVGQTNGTAIVVEAEEQLDTLDYSKHILLFSQTTQSIDGFNRIVSIIKERLHDGVSFGYKDTICRQVANRIPQIRKFATQHDVIFFLSDTKSSNGKVLYNECKKINSHTYFLNNPDEFDANYIKGVSTIGISGATSTPKWQMEKLRMLILASTEQPRFDRKD